MACNCGFHVVKPANAPQSVASVSAPGATPSAQRTFLRPPPSLSMYTKSRFSGSQSASLKPHLVARKSPSSSPPSTSSVRTSMPAPSSVSSPSTSSVRTSMPAPSSVSSPSTSSVRTSMPAPSSVCSPSTSSVRISMPAPSPVSTAVNTILAVGSNESGGDEPATAAAASFWLPREMSKAIPVQDQRWISNTLFNSGKLRPHLKLWYEPPVPALIYHQPPMPDRFFTHRLMVWMPYHLWNVRVFCPTCGKQLTGGGVHRRSRKVLDIDRYYLMVTETLRCSVCVVNFLSTSQTVRDQLDLPHQKMFRLILTHKYACDIRVIRLLRERTLGNSPTRLVKQLKENHGEEWLNRLAHYLGECADFITKKLSGHAKGTALWVTSIGNEVGQIVTSVLTVQEGPALDTMVSGVMERYRQAAVPPPVLLYVDCGCCVSDGTSMLHSRFSDWPDLHIRLDIWHFMRRLAVGCTTDAHPLYPTFMGCLSACIFEWDARDLTLLRQAKRALLVQEGVPGLTDQMVDGKISKKELSLYCRRRTRGEVATITLIEQLLEKTGGQ
ncbi:hypothetical protein JOQ06_015954 [Pogonophryne albipinna]|uniref:DUF6729 domain-containing protein n=1 Tax=Pogonophryne albipinna TaxID=1090488 RepID=A0AAD6ANY8_9TELE|nr:hypothetical protein JOQ06_015954 [Pogonophryne albipinna]